MASIAITNTGTTPINVGQTGTFTITATNNGPQTANNIQINDPTPTGYTAGTPTAGTYNKRHMDNKQPNKRPNSNTNIHKNNDHSRCRNNHNQPATATWTEYPTTTTIPDSTIHVNQANLSITNTGTTPINVGQTGTFTITVTNTGPDTANNIQINDPTTNRIHSQHTTTGTYNGTNMDNKQPRQAAIQQH